MKKAILLSNLVILFLSLTLTSTSLPPGSPTRQLTNLPASQLPSWSQVDSLANLGQPRSALELVEKIYERAKTAQNDPQVIKAVLYRIRLNSDFQENYLERAVHEVKSEIKVSETPRKQILQSILAELYRKYYQANQYRFRDRSEVAGSGSDSISTWDLTTLYRAIVRNYLLSLEGSAELQKIKISRFTDILEIDFFGEKKKEDEIARAAKMQPTLFDFLAHRALDFFTAGESAEIVPANRFEMDQSWYFGTTANFIRNRMMIPSDTSAPASFALRIFRDLATFHFQDKDRAALTGTELKRLGFVHERGLFPGKDSLYLSVLGEFEKAESGSPYSTLVSFALAEFLNMQGQQYQPLVSALHKQDVQRAVRICDKAISQYPDSDGAKNCAVLKKSMVRPMLRILTEKAVPVQKPSLAMVHFKNIPALWFRLLRLDPEQYQENTASMDQEAIIRYLLSVKPDKSWKVTMPDDGDLQNHSLEVRIPETSAGFYLLLASPSEKFDAGEENFSWTPFWSTQISFITRKVGGNALGYYLLDRVTGQPLKTATAEVWTQTYDYRERRFNRAKLSDLVADNNGYITVPADDEKGKSPDIFLKIRYKSENFTTARFYRWPDYPQPERTFIQTTFFTDRSIYRPGQMIYFKGIVVERNGDDSKIKTEYPVKVTFSDVNGRKISEMEAITSDFGSFSGSFTAPQDVLPGQMTIFCETGSTQVQVEYYKLPTFEVTYNPLEGNYKLAEPLVVKGLAKAFAGNAITAAAVKYRVVRTARFPWHDRFWYRPIPDSPETEIAAGTTKTDENGQFTINFTAIPDYTVEKKSNPVFDFMITADVTDINGETQSVQQVVSVGYTSLLIGINTPDMVDPAKDSVFKLTATNLQERATAATIQATLHRLRQPDRPMKSRDWGRPDLNLMTRDEFHANFPYDVYGDEDDPATWKSEKMVYEQSFRSDRDSLIRFTTRAIPDLKPGYYQWLLKAVDPFGQPVEVKRYFTVYSATSNTVPVTGFWWFVPRTVSGEPGGKAQFLIGSSEENVQVMYEVTCRDSLLSREWLKLSNRSVLLEIPITERHRGNFAVNFVFVHQNRVFQESQLITVPWSDKKLDVRLETFRDRILPGSRETWKMKISGQKGAGVKAELLATMYDAALDAFKPHQLNFNIFRRFSGISPWSGDHSFSVSTGMVKMPGDAGEGYIIVPDLQLNWFGFSYFQGHSRYRRGAKGGPEVMMAMDMGRPEGNEKSADDVMLFSKLDGPDKRDSVGDKREKPQSKTGAEITVRRYFRETAFFYPTMRTDSTGAMSLQFTVPESLTRWKLLGLAHSQNLEYGFIEKEVISQKSLMLFPNAPRFVRQGDTLVFSSRIVNLAEKELSGEVTILLWDAISQKTFNHLVLAGGKEPGNLNKQPFSIGKGQSGMVQWRIFFPVSTDLSLLSFRITAKAGNFSDAEERVIPVLSNRMMVTETLPLPVRGKGTTTFSFSKLLQSGKDPDATLKNYRLTLEFATNPAWYAIQALPTLNDYPYETAESIFSAWWANSVSAFIMNSNPKIRAVFDAWKNIVPNALKSNLSKNEALKSALLQETPWVMDATTESEQKQKLGVWFDQNRITETLGSNLRKLIRLQSPSGGWCWMPGMRENRYTTQAIVTGIGKLHHLGIKNISNDPETKQMLVKAIRYLDEQLVKDLRDAKKYDPAWMKNNHLSSLQVQYLYALSFFGERSGFAIQHQEADFEEAFTYFKQQAEKYWNKQDRYMQGMISLALHRLGNKEVPALIQKSLLEKALMSPEMGMYWAAEPGFYWFQAPLETHALMVEAFDEVSGDQKVVEALKVWLLKQKQTRMWKSARATQEACYALLLRGNELLTAEPGNGDEQFSITLGKEKIVPEEFTEERQEPGTGYFKISWSGSEIKPEMGNVTVTKTGNGVAWGALYWQYFENLDKITPAASPLKLQKQLFVNSSSQLTSLPAYQLTSSLHPGDNLTVRITLTTDRDLEFVHLKDMRASSLEPAQLTSSPTHQLTSLSGYRYQDGLGYYQSTTDVATNFFFDYLPKGTWVFEYNLKVNAAGTYSNGIATVQCMYAPEFAAHGEGGKLVSW